jgi:hypothetical protein
MDKVMANGNAGSSIQTVMTHGHGVSSHWGGKAKGKKEDV